MFNISKLLEKFSKEIASDESNKEIIKNILEKQLSLEVDIKSIEIKDYIVSVKSTPGVGNKIFINKNKILEDFKNLLPIKIVDIK